MKTPKQNKVAVVGMACRFPDADSPQQLWENILSKRAAFRKIPSVRLSETYFSDDLSDADATYSYKAAVLKNYSFPRDKYKISKSVFNSTDFAHWLALDVAAEALEDANFDLTDYYKEVTGVFVGNTLTGEFSRANLLRLRWPYVSKIIIKELQNEGWDHERIEKFINETEEKFKSPFAPMTEDSLAGGLSNTIAGRICNYFDFNGGGYTVDGACSSSLLAVSNACNAISSGDLMIAIAGGVDLSLDPFELVGFSRVGALAKNRMLVYDKNSSGFLPGEGCGFIVLMNYKEAVKQNLNIIAVVNGWGISSDGQGGLTRPTTHGQLLSFNRAYEKAGYSIGDLGYIEGHGTGTKVGDETEINTISEAINLSSNNGTEIYLGSIKANIGHCKAAAGIAGLMKTILCLQNQLIPPATGNKDLHPAFQKSIVLKLPEDGKIWSGNKDLKSAVSSMGFGGINTHVTLSSPSNKRRKKIQKQEELLLSSYQTSELFLFSSDSAANLKEQIKTVLNYSAQLSFSELIDLSFALFKNIKKSKYRASIIADEPGELTRKLNLILAAIDKEINFNDLKEGIFFSSGESKFRIGFLFPGQGTLNVTQHSFIESRFRELNNNHFDSTHSETDTSTKQHQTSVVNYSISALNLLKKLGINAQTAVGHSLGELTALYWSGVYSSDDFISLVKYRGELMSHCHGSMLSVNSDINTINKLIIGKEISLACINTFNQLVLSGSDEAIDSFQKELKSLKIPSAKLNVAGAFHSPLMKPVQEPFGNFLKKINFNKPKRKVVSTVLGKEVSADDDLRKILTDQFLSPVQFVDAIKSVDDKIDLWIEAGSGKTLTGMVSSISGKPVISVDSGSKDISEFLKIAGIIFCNDKEFLPDYLFSSRFHREFDLNWKAEFLMNPCEKIIAENIPIIKKRAVESSVTKTEAISAGGFLVSFKEILSDHLELPAASLNSKARMLDDLHLNSITVGQLLAQAAKQYSIPLPKTPAEYSNASIEEIADYFETVSANKDNQLTKEPAEPASLNAWVKEFSISLKEAEESEGNIPELNNGRWTEISCGKIGEEVKSSIALVKALPIKGILTILFSDDEKEIINTLAATINHVKNDGEIEHLVFIQNKNSASGFAKSIFLERRNLKVSVITVVDKSASPLIDKEIYFNKGIKEVVYQNNRKFEPELILLENIKHADQPLIKSDDVVLVTGGGKGITAECAFALAKKTSCSLVITGRSKRESDEKLNSNLKRFDAAGIKYLYEPADMNDTGQLSAAIKKAESKFGTITTVIHGAGVNSPISFTALDFDKIYKTISPKVYGLRNCLSLLKKDKLKSVITFGSIIGSSGMQGNADYALANEWMRNEMEKFGSEYPGCKCLNFEWSVWSGSGMGENLNVLEQLISNGISPISLDNGVKEFMKLVESNLPSSSLIISGRFGNLPTLSYTKCELPLLRFLDDIRVYYPGIELISDFVLSGSSDLYLKDHQIEGTYVFPGVMGLEAMMQAATALFQLQGKTISIRNIEFHQPILLKPNEKLKVRVLAERNSNGEIETSIRSEGTGFVVDHFTAKFSFTNELPEKTDFIEKNTHRSVGMNADFVYENLLFHSGRFKCLREYKTLSPYSCTAIASTGEMKEWYGNYYSAVNLLGNAVLRDACLHAIQACVPSHTLLPVSIRELKIYSVLKEGEIEIEARELYRDNNIFCYDIVCKNSSGRITEIMREVKFSLMKSTERKKMNLSTAQIVLQRKADELSKTKIEINFNPVFENGSILKRADGKPFLKSENGISISNHDKTVMTAEGRSIIGCDLEIVNETAAELLGLISGKELSSLSNELSLEYNEHISNSSTRVWSAMECLKKAGSNLLSSISLESKVDNEFVIFKSGKNKIISYCTFIDEYQKETVFSVLINNEEEF